jgi:hypothetical protein
MGVIYAAVPLEEEFCAYLDEMDIDYPEVNVVSRAPSPNDLLEVFPRCGSLDIESGFIAGSWTASIERSESDYRTTIHLHESNDLDVEGSLVFEKGSPELIILILKELSKELGPFGLVPDTGEEPLIVTKELDVELAIKSWCHTLES